jgi:hypothetical protein
MRIAALLTFLACIGGFAQPASAQIDLFCEGPDAIIDKFASGDLVLTTQTAIPADKAGIVQRSPTELGLYAVPVITPRIENEWTIPLGPEGRPKGKPTLLRTTIVMGQLQYGVFTNSAELRLELSWPGGKSPMLALEGNNYNLGSVVAIGGSDPAKSGSENVLPPATLEAMALAAENGGTVARLYRNGVSYIEIKFPKPDLGPARQELIAWILKTAPAMATSDVCSMD